jgi:hypothetical protein
MSAIKQFRTNNLAARTCFQSSQIIKPASIESRLGSQQPTNTLHSPRQTARPRPAAASPRPGTRLPSVALTHTNPLRCVSRVRKRLKAAPPARNWASTARVRKAQVAGVRKRKEGLPREGPRSTCPANAHSKQAKLSTRLDDARQVGGRNGAVQINCEGRRAETLPEAQPHQQTQERPAWTDDQHTPSRHARTSLKMAWMWFTMREYSTSVICS